MGQSRPLSGANSPYQITYRPPGPIATGGPADWFGPLNPMSPTAPPEVKGRILDYPSGYNLNVRPRTGEGITFEMLRAFADQYDLLRLLIETRKDQMARLRFDIVPRAKDKRKRGATIETAMQDRINVILEFFLRPDKENFWDDWLRMLLEDLFVCDAPTIYRRKTFGGELFALQPLDGANIKRVIDDWGNTPMAPAPAYQQVLKGYPAVDYTTEELIYRPRNKRTHKIYGYSPVEQILMTINIGMRRQTWQLQSFTEGNIPEALIGTPATWTPDQVRQFQDWFDSMLEGNTAQRRKARFVPGDVAKGYIPTKPDELFGAAEDWLIRVMCFAFNISPQPFIKMMNRATAESAQEVAAAEGLAPIQNWVKNLMDTLLIEDFKSPDLEFIWAEEDELDPNIKSQIIDREQAAGRLTYNEARREQGLDPDPSPDADRAMFKSATGWTPIFLTDEEKAANDAKANAIAGLDPDGNPLPAKPGEDDGSGDDGSDPTKPGSTPPGNGGTPPGAGEVAEKSDRPFPAHRHGPGCSHNLAKAGKASSSKSYADPLRPYVAKREKKLARKMSAALAKLGEEVIKYLGIKNDTPPALEKADGKGGWTVGDKSGLTADEAQAEIDKLLEELDFATLASTQDDLIAALEEVGKDSSRISLGQIGITLDDDQITNKVNTRAVEWARERSAELVDIDADDDTSLFGTTRDMIRGTIADGLENNLSTSEIGDALEEAYAFSDDRAQLIAATEVTSANSQASLASYQEAAELGVSVQKSWLVLEDGCDICQENADAGAIDLEDTFPSGDTAPGAHPNCRCVLVPVVTDADGNETEGSEGDDVGDGGDMELADRPDMIKAEQPRNLRGKFTSDPGQSFMSGMVQGIPGVKAKVVHVITELAAAEGIDGEDDTEITEKVAKLDNRDEMSTHFPVDLDLRGVIWAMGGNTEEAKAERESSLLQFVPFDQCVATQDFCDRDKVALYIEDPTAKGFAPMAYKMGDVYAIQDGHHRAVASKTRGEAGMSMNVRDLKDTPLS